MTTPTYTPADLRDELRQYSPDPMIRVVMMPKDTNYQGSIFGGVILSYLDLAGAEQAHKVAGRRVVTKVMKGVDFVARVDVGDWVSFYARTEHVGHTSLTIRILVVAHRGLRRENLFKVTEAEVVFVAVDSNGNPVPISSRDDAATS